MVDTQPLAAIESRINHQRIEDGFVPDQRDRIEIWILGERELDGRDGFGGTEIAAHGIDRDAARYPWL